MQKYKGKYRSESNRLRGWDYSSDGHYFITINTYDRACLFGDIVDGKMILNDFGKIATDEWFKSFEMRKELFLGEFILMPNHLHAIVGLDGGGNDIDGIVDAHGRAHLQYHQYQPQNYHPQPFQRKPKSISSFVAGYKSVVLTKIDDYIDARQLPIQKFNRRNPLWQANYYDHIIRDGQSYERIAEYIRMNPEKWEEGKKIIKIT